MKNKVINFKILAALSFLMALVIIYCLSIWVIFTDISLEAIDKENCVEINSAEFKPRLPVTLISYADGAEVFYRNQNFQVFSALNRGVDQFILYRRNMIDPVFYEKNAHILKEKFGAGYWLWKPQIILQTMKMMPKDSIIIYMDSGFCIKNNLKPVLKALEKNDVLIAEDGEKAQKPYLELMVNKDTLKTLGVALKENEHVKPLWAAFIAVRNTEKARKFIETWLHYCEQKELIMQYMNDQMLLGLVAHQYPQSVYTMPEPTVNDILVWHHRKTGVTEQNRSLLPYLCKHVRRLESVFMNMGIFSVFRDFMLTHVKNKQMQMKEASILATR